MPSSNAGRVVNMASGLARMAVPMRSAYVASKYAVAGFTECLRLGFLNKTVNSELLIFKACQGC